MGVIAELCTFALLAFSSAWLETLAHERGHARVALEHTTGVRLDAGWPPLAILPARLSSFMGLKGADVYVGPLPGGSCGHDGFSGNANLIRLYRGGTRGAVVTGAKLVPLVLSVSALGVVAGVDSAVIAAAWLFVALYWTWVLADFLPNRLWKAPPGTGRTRHGTDGHHLRLLKCDQTYVPPTLPAAAATRAERKGQVLGLR